MSLGRILLLLGAIVGGVVAGLGLLVLLVSATDNTMSPSDRNDAVLGSLFIAGIGLTLFVPCLAVLIVVWRKSPLPALQPGSSYAAVPPGLAPAEKAMLAQGPDLTKPYLEWFGWCQREIGGDAIALHAATMAALSRGLAGDTGGALAAGRRAAQAASPSTLPGPPAKVPGAKVRLLARIGAGTLPLLEPEETVIASFYANDRRPMMWQLGFGLIGYLIAASQLGAYYLSVTDRRVILLGGSQLVARPTTLVFAVPRSMISEVSFRSGIVRDSFAITRVTGERNRLVVLRMWRAETARAQQVLSPGLLPTPMPAPPSLR